jgi:hypothetical protein
MMTTPVSSRQKRLSRCRTANEDIDLRIVLPGYCDCLLYVPTKVKFYKKWSNCYWATLSDLCLLEPNTFSFFLLGLRASRCPLLQQLKAEGCDITEAQHADFCFDPRPHFAECQLPSLACLHYLVKTNFILVRILLRPLKTHSEKNGDPILGRNPDDKSH